MTIRSIFFGFLMLQGIIAAGAQAAAVATVHSVLDAHGVSETPLKHPSFFERHQQMIRLWLLDRSQRFALWFNGQRDLAQAASDNDVNRVRELLDAGVDVNAAPSITTDRDQFEAVPVLQRAVFKKNAEVIALLLAHKDINVNQTTSCSGSTALHQAVILGHIQTIKQLLVHPDMQINALAPLVCKGQKVVKDTRSAVTALDLAYYFNRTEIIEILQASGARCAKDLAR